MSYKEQDKVIIRANGQWANMAARIVTIVEHRHYVVVPGYERTGPLWFREEELGEWQDGFHDELYFNEPKLADPPEITIQFNDAVLSTKEQAEILANLNEVLPVVQLTGKFDEPFEDAKCIQCGGIFMHEAACTENLY